MKIRTDFVTNSSSSSFTVIIKFDLVDGCCLKYSDCIDLDSCEISQD